MLLFCHKACPLTWLEGHKGTKILKDKSNNIKPKFHLSLRDLALP